MGIINSLSHEEPDSDMLRNIFKVTNLPRGENRSQVFVSLFPELFPQQCSNAISLFNRSVISDSLWPHGLQHARLLCPLPSLGVCPNSCPLSQWCHPTTLSSDIPFSSCLLSFLALGSFPVSWLFTSGGQSIGDSASASALPMNIQSWFPLGFTGLISLQSKGLSRVFSSTSLKAPILRHSASFMVQLSHPYVTTGKNIALTIWTFVGKVMSLFFNMLSRSVITFLPRSKHIFSWLQSPSAVILEPKKIKFLTVSVVSPSIFHEVVGLDAMILVFWVLSFMPAFSLSSFSFINAINEE